MAPAQTDEIAKLVGITDFNQMIRNSKQQLNTITGQVKDLNDASGGLLLNSAEENIKRARDAADQMKNSIADTKNTIEGKVTQGKQILDTANSLKTQIDSFATLTGATIGTGSSTASGETASGISQTLPVK